VLVDATGGIRLTELGIKGLLSRLTGLTVIREMVEDNGVRVEDFEIEVVEQGYWVEESWLIGT